LPPDDVADVDVADVDVAVPRSRFFLLASVP